MILYCIAVYYYIISHNTTSWNKIWYNIVSDDTKSCHTIHKNILNMILYCMILYYKLWYHITYAVVLYDIVSNMKYNMI